MSNPIFIHVAVEYCVLNLGDPGIEAVETIDVCPGVTAEIVTTPDPYCVTVTVVPIGNGVVILGGNWKFTDEQIIKCYEACNLAGIDYMEIGFRNFKKKEFIEKYGKTFFCDEDYINSIISFIF